MNIIESFFKSDTVDYIFAAITCILGCITILMGALAGSNAGDDFTIHAVAVAIIAIGFGLIFFAFNQVSNTGRDRDIYQIKLNLREITLLLKDIKEVLQDKKED